MSLDVNLKTKTSYGPWQVLGKLGRGGMGEVLLVERSAPRQRAALKLLPRVQSEEERRSYQREQSFLHRIEHPNIARLIDSGETAEGRPYLVLELVEGERIDDFCRRRELCLEARLRLFLDVCGAVAAAHQQLVVHCDLKPSNVLVRSEDGVVKLLDFGLARQVTDKMSTSTLVSSYSTWAYASPEQLAGRPLSTASDVYSLGVLLFEILTDTRLFAVVEPGFLNHIEARRDPPRASGSLGHGSPERWRRALEQDLDYVVAKTLQPEPEGRYGSVVELAEELEAFLAGLPVKARQTDRFYTWHRRLRRNVVPVLAATLLVAAALGATAMLGLQARQLAAQRDLARHHEEVAQKTSDFFLNLLRSLPDSGVTGPRSIRDLAALAVAELDFELSDVGQVRARVLDMLSEHYRFVGNVGQAELLREEAMELWKAQRGEESLEYIQALEGLAFLRLEAGAIQSGCELAEETARIAYRLKDEASIGLALNVTGFCAFKENRIEVAGKLWEQAESMALEQHGFGSVEHEALLQNLLKVKVLSGQDSEVEEVYRRLISSRKLRRPANLDLKSVEWRFRLATAKVARQALEEAETELNSLLEQLRSRNFTADRAGWIHTGEIELQLAEIHRRRGQPEEALRLARIASARLRRDLPPDSPRHRVARRIEAFALLEAGHFSEAREALEQVMAEIDATGSESRLEEAEIREALSRLSQPSSSSKGGSQGPTLP